MMRTSLVPGLIEAAVYNIARQIKNLKLFEIGKTFIKSDRQDLPIEPEILTALWTGPQKETAWHSREVPCDFYDMKGAVEGLIQALATTLTNDLISPLARRFLPAEGTPERDRVLLVLRNALERRRLEQTVREYWDSSEERYRLGQAVDGDDLNVFDHSGGEPIATVRVDRRRFRRGFEASSCRQRTCGTDKKNDLRSRRDPKVRHSVATPVPDSPQAAYYDRNGKALIGRST